MDALVEVPVRSLVVATSICPIYLLSISHFNFNFIFLCLPIINSKIRFQSKELAKKHTLLKFFFILNTTKEVQFQRSC